MLFDVVVSVEIEVGVRPIEATVNPVEVGLTAGRQRQLPGPVIG
jgi:hypothetical protein